MKRTVSLLLIIAILATLLVGLSACYVSRPDTMDHLVGTYALVSYTRKPKDAPSEADPTDMIKEKEIVAYLVVKSNGTGYYVYKDKNTPAYARSIQIAYSYDEDHSESVKEIRYNDGLVSSGDGYPGKGKETLGLNFTKKEKKLTYSMPAIFGRDYSQSVRYEKVDDSTGLSYASKKMGTTLTACDYELNGLNILQSMDYYVEYNPYVYRIYSINAVDKKADLYYALKEDQENRVQRDLAVSWAYTTENEIKTLTVTIGDTTYTRYVDYNGAMQGGLNLVIPATGDTPEQYISFYATTGEIETLVQDAMDTYHTYLESMQPIE